MIKTLGSLIHLLLLIMVNKWIFLILLNLMVRIWFFFEWRFKSYFCSFSHCCDSLIINRTVEQFYFICFQRDDALVPLWNILRKLPSKTMRKKQNHTRSAEEFSYKCHNWICKEKTHVQNLEQPSIAVNASTGKAVSHFNELALH